MSLQGTIETFAIADVLRLLAATNKTGRLQVQGPARAGTVWVDGGKVLGAESASTPNANHVTDVLFQLVRFDRGSFSFELDRHPPQPGEPVDIEAALGDAESMVAEWRELERRVPSTEAWVSLRPELPEDQVTVTAEQWKVVSAVGSGRPVAAIGDALALSELPAVRAVDQLFSLGLVDVGVAPAPQPGADRHDDASDAGEAVLAPPVGSDGGEVGRFDEDGDQSAEAAGEGDARRRLDALAGAYGLPATPDADTDRPPGFLSRPPGGDEAQPLTDAAPPPPVPAADSAPGAGAAGDAPVSAGATADGPAADLLGGSTTGTAASERAMPPAPPGYDNGSGYDSGSGYDNGPGYDNGAGYGQSTYGQYDQGSNAAQGEYGRQAQSDFGSAGAYGEQPPGYGDPAHDVYGQTGAAGYGDPSAPPAFGYDQYYGDQSHAPAPPSALHDTSWAPPAPPAPSDGPGSGPVEDVARARAIFESAAPPPPPPPPAPGPAGVGPASQWLDAAGAERLAPPPPPPPPAGASFGNGSDAGAGSEQGATAATTSSSAADNATDDITRQLQALSPKAQEAVKRSSGLYEDRSPR